ncbi:4-hydroxybenzoate octaprenyltransferase [Theileria orientalis strain Shintoku]|uniref:4-hydroxybenzoate polyprenyltransferase, mitochondrial n=1 Tax=Theileria orientalis strain Shintoku TaxID=869250 RepID=J4C8H8_THEOR|nr:4-hydroxybenzoate octaprenyltransferase [Theileria orientalis strain Shintoku]BAM40813.1 4-hydroxybenzoate octaprenyltransferase [Theileria orientalis strain Shintoku]|eukprot:XP_009691114.1 4-hydroxybenzoate octaprenyltransferase [Theileria orientalis strain Shintoku]
MFNRIILQTRRDLVNIYSNNLFYRSIVPKHKTGSNYNHCVRLYVTNTKINDLNNDKLNRQNDSPFLLPKLRHIHVNNSNPSKNVGFYDKIASCGRLMRIHSLMPVVIFALPAMWSASLALPSVVTFLELKKMGLMCLGAFFARSAGCCINDLFDKNFDKHVERTKIRPLASGLIGTKEALTTLAFNSAMALSILLQFDTNTIMLGFLTSITCSLYPLMKRYTNYAQLILGMSSSIGTLMAWTIISGGPITLPPIFIYLTASIWPMIYDTIYAHQDKEFDKKLGLKSLALLWGDNTKKMCNLVAYNMSILLATCGYFAKLGDPFYASVVLSHLWMMRQLKNVNLEDPANCFRFFKNSVIYGGIILAGILAGKKELSLDLKFDRRAKSNI